MDKNMFNDIVGSLNEAVNIAKGEAWRKEAFLTFRRASGKIKLKKFFKIQKGRKE